MSPASYQTAPPRVACNRWNVGQLECEKVVPSNFPTFNFPTFQSGKRDSNPRPQPWQGCALPTELFPRAAKSNRSVGLYLPPCQSLTRPTEWTRGGTNP